MKSVIRIALCLALAGFSIAHAISPKASKSAASPATTHKPSGQKADAKTLLTDADKALAVMIKAARADKGLDAKTPKNKPFWKSTQTIAKNVKAAEKGLVAKNDDFFKGIARARRAEEQLKIDWQLTDSKNKTVIENAKKLGHSIALLRTQFSKEAARKKKGGELTASEKENFAKIKTQEKAVLAALKKLEKEASKDKALEKGLHKIQAQAHHIEKEPLTLDAYLATLYLLDEQFGLLRGYEYYVDKSWRADYLVLLNYETTYDTLYVSWESSTSYEWSSVETSVDIYENEEVDTSETVSEEEISSEESYASEESFEMTDSEEEEVAAEEDTDAEVDADDTADDDSMDDASDDEGEDMSDDSGDDGGGDDSGDDDGGGDDGGGDDGGDE